MTNTLGALLEARADNDRSPDSTTDALWVPGTPERRYDAPRLLTDARKTGNFLRQLGVAPGRVVAIADRPVPESVLSLFGAALLGATVRFSATGEKAPTENEDGIEPARVAIGPTGEIDRLAVDAPNRIGYGNEPTAPETAYFEQDVWSENPTFPPTTIDPESDVLAASGRTYDHRALIEAADRIESEGLAAGSEVVLRAPLSDPRAVVAGLLAPIARGATIVFPDGETTGDLAVCEAAGSVPEADRVALEAIDLNGSRKRR